MNPHSSSSNHGSVNFRIWEARWSALDTVIEGYLQELNMQHGPKVATIKNLLAQLKIFGEFQFNFFNYGFKQNLLEVSADTPPENALYIILNQVSKDLEVLQKAISQRTIGSSAMKDTLIRADNMALKALIPAKNAGLLSSIPAIVTYFQKSPSIRIIPYASVALIGIPYTCIDVPADLLAIYHEVGHFVYWKGEKKGVQTYREISNTIASELYRQTKFPYWLYNWREEIFADVYGTKVGGTAMAAGFQEWLLRNSLFSFFEDDSEHPIPACRPIIHNKILTLINSEKDQEDINELVKVWQKKTISRYQLLIGLFIENHVEDNNDLEKVNNDKKPSLNSSSQDENISSENIEEIIKSYESKKYKKSLKSTIVNKSEPSSILDEKFEDSINKCAIENINDYFDIVIDKIYSYLVPDSLTIFDKLINNEVEITNIPELYASDDAFWTEWVKSKYETRVYFNSNKLISIYYDNLKRNNTNKKLPANIWSEILFADGWTSGPADNPRPK